MRDPLRVVERELVRPPDRDAVELPDRRTNEGADVREDARVLRTVRPDDVRDPTERPAELRYVLLTTTVRVRMGACQPP